MAALYNIHRLFLLGPAMAVVILDLVDWVMGQAEHLQLEGLFAHLSSLEVLVQAYAHRIYRLHFLLVKLVANQVSVSVLSN